MHYLKNRKYRLTISLAAALIAAAFFTISPPRPATAPALAWWGTLYPKFCFSNKPESASASEVKITFWLAKALNWC